MNKAQISEAMKAIGSLGGKARSENLTDEEKVKIASLGGKARWKKSKKAKSR